MSKARENVLSLGLQVLFWLGLMVLCVCLLIALIAWRLSWPATFAISGDKRNADVSVTAHGRGWLSLSSMTLDLFTVRPDVTPLELERSLFEAAAAVKGRHYMTVALARSGREVFVMSGDDFRQLGEEYAAGENPVYLVRTLPEHMLTTDGQRAFPTWEGGMLSVLGKQMEDTKRLAEEWVAGRHEEARVPPP